VCELRQVRNISMRLWRHCTEGLRESAALSSTSHGRTRPACAHASPRLLQASEQLLDNGPD
jgi:hypothetical protein